MPRLARIVVPGIPHHITQRGARRMRVFFDNRDYLRYKQLLGLLARRYQLAIWAYCLMPNHVHLVAVPSTGDGLARPLGETHRRFAAEVNRRHGWTGHLWQQRFDSVPLDEPHLFAAVRYVLLNPVRAALVQKPEDWPHSSARAHLSLEQDALPDCDPMARRISDWSAYLADDGPSEERNLIRAHTRTGRPLGSLAFVRDLEKRSNRKLLPRRRGAPARHRS